MADSPEIVAVINKKVDRVVNGKISVILKIDFRLLFSGDIGNPAESLADSGFNFMGGCVIRDADGKGDLFFFQGFGIVREFCFEDFPVGDDHQMIVHGAYFCIVPVDFYDLTFMGIQADPVPDTDGSVDGDNDTCKDIGQKRLQGKAQDDGHNAQRGKVACAEFWDVLAEKEDDEERDEDDLDEVPQKLGNFILFFLNKIVVKKDDINKGKKVIKKNEPKDKGVPGIDIGNLKERRDFQADIERRDR